MASDVTDLYGMAVEVSESFWLLSASAFPSSWLGLK